MRKNNFGPRTCAIHNPGDQACGPDCPSALREPLPQATLSLVSAPSAPADDESPMIQCAVHPDGRFCPPFCDARITPVRASDSPSRDERNTPSSEPGDRTIGPDTVDEMDEALRDVEQRDEDFPDEGDEDDGEMAGDADPEDETPEARAQAVAVLTDEGFTADEANKVLDRLAQVRGVISGAV